MAATIDDTRDLRSAHQDSKRFRDSTNKWSYGARPSGGCGLDWVTMEATKGSESQREKERPYRRRNNTFYHNKRNQNITKGRASWEVPQKRVQSFVNARDEMEDRDLSHSAGALRPPYDHVNPNENLALAFEVARAPGFPQSLDVFVKAPTERDTERLVQREYEVLDTRGQALRGKKARQGLRTGSAESSTVEDGFELV